MRKAFLLAASASAGLLWGVAASAQTSAAQRTTVTGQAKSPANEIVCEKQEVIGSRLATQKICKTRAQWEEDRRGDRAEVERVQTQRGCGKNGC